MPSVSRFGEANEEMHFINDSAVMKRQYIKPATISHNALGCLLLEQLPISNEGVNHGEAHERNDAYDEEEEVQEFLGAIAAEKQTPLW